MFTVTTIRANGRESKGKTFANLNQAEQKATRQIEQLQAARLRGYATVIRDSIGNEIERFEVTNG